jgi:hypothetical protein
MIEQHWGYNEPTVIGQMLKTPYQSSRKHLLHKLQPNSYDMAPVGP